MEQPLFLHVRLDQLYLLLGAAGELEVAQGLLIHREDPHGGAVLGCHVADGGAVGEGQGGDPGTVELDELSHYALLAEHLRHGEHEVGRGRALAELAGEAEAHHLGNQHGDRLPQHRGLRLDSSHTPAEHTESVDHRGVRVGAHEGVGIGLRRAALGREHHPREVFEVDLVHDAGVGRHDAESLERPLRPPQQGVPLAVALELEVGIHLERRRGAELVHDHRMVDHELGGEERFDLLRVAAHLLHRVAHGGEVHHRRHAGEILHEDARRHEGDLVVGRLLRVPARQALDFGRRHRAAVLAAQQVFEQDAERVRQARDGEAAPLERVQPIDLEGAAGGLERRAGPETVGRRHSTTFTSATKYSVSPKQLVGMPLCCLYVSATRLPMVWLMRAAMESCRTVK